MTAALIQNVLGAELPGVDRARGVWVYDTAGTAYLDGCSGAMAVNLGHSHPRVVQTMREQAERVTFTHRGAFTPPALQRLAARLSGLTGFAGVWFVDSGSEAVEAAMQFAIQYHRERGRERAGFLSHARSYHGNTLGALSLSGHARRSGFGALALDFPRLPSPFAVPGDGGSPRRTTADLVGEAERIIRECAEELAAVVFEPVGGATLGAAIPDGAYLRGLREICTREGVLLIADEVMTGLGRTGRMLACEHHGVVPDLVALGKGVAAGASPIAATLVGEPVLRALAEGSGRSPGGHTYAGNPFSAAVAETVLDVLVEEGLVERAAERGAYLDDRLRELLAGHRLLAETRGAGLLRAVELVREEDDQAGPPGALAALLAAEALRQGLLVYPATGGYTDACIIAPPLTVTEAEIDELVHRLGRAVRVLERRGTGREAAPVRGDGAGRAGAAGRTDPGARPPGTDRGSR